MELLAAGMHPTYMLPVVVRVLVVLPAKTLEVLQGLRWRCEGWRVGWGRKGCSWLGCLRLLLLPLLL